MCFYDQHRFECGDWKWGEFRQHCSREYRAGETCGMKLVMQRYRVQKKCKICDSIDSRRRRLAQERERLRCWTKEANRYSESIEEAVETIEVLNGEIYAPERERQKRSLALAEGRIKTPGGGANDSDGVQRGVPNANLGSNGPMAPSSTQGLGFMNTISDVTTFARALSDINNGSPRTYAKDPKSKLEPDTKEKAKREVGVHLGAATAILPTITSEHKPYVPLSPKS